MNNVELDNNYNTEDREFVAYIKQVFKTIEKIIEKENIQKNNLYLSSGALTSDDR